MTGRDISDLFEELMWPSRRTGRVRIAPTPLHDPRVERDGYRVEYVDGEKREYELTEDGEWERVDDEVSFDVRETMDGQEVIADLEGRISPESTFVGATFNNGVLKAEFEYSGE